MSGNVTTNMTSFYQNTTLYDTFLMTHGHVYDFQKIACIDWDDVEVEHSLAPRAYTSWNALNILRLTLAMWIMGSHVAIIVFVLAMRGLRSQPKNLLIVNVALTNLLMGAFVVPVKLHFILNPDVMACDLAIGWTFISDYFQTSVSLFAVFSLVLERFIYVFTEKKQIYVKPWASRLITVVLLVSPWLLAAILLAPTFYGGMLAKSHEQ